MSEDKKNTDPLLAAAIASAYKTEHPYQVFMVVDGVALSGSIVNPERGIAEFVRVPGFTNAQLEQIGEYIRRERDDYIFLKNVIVHSPAGIPTAPYLLVRLSFVSVWRFGAPLVDAAD